MTSKPVVLVTGASRGIGLAVTQILLAEGAHVIALNRTRSSELEQLENSYPNDLEVKICDITSLEGVTIPVLDGLVLNAGILGPLSRVASSTLSDWKNTFDVNFFSLISLLQLALPSLRERKGRVVFVSSGAATGTYAGWGPYSATKAAMNSLCRTIAKEEKDVTFVALRPGAVDTQMQATIREPGSRDALNPEDIAKFVGLYEDGKLVKPEDCGRVIARLALRAPNTISGQFLTVDFAEQIVGRLFLSKVTLTDQLGR